MLQISNLMRVYQNLVAMVQTSGTKAAVKSDQKPIFISVSVQGGANPSLSASRLTETKNPAK
jgi:hypothetical protein